MSLTIPTVILEEHHEAFAVWSYADRQGWIQSRANTLLHVDSHDDLMAPVFRTPLPVDAAPDTVADFVYREMDVATFIWPAVDTGIVNRLVFLYHSHPAGALGWRKLSIRSRDNARMDYVIASASGDSFAPVAAGTRHLDYAKVLPSMCIDKDQSILLDIDLDYFLAHELPSPAAPEIEIMAETYRCFVSNPYHLLRLMPRLKVSALEREGRYFFRFFDGPRQARQHEEEDRLIVDRMTAFLSFLRRNEVQPRLISICRSRLSGYTPERVVDTIQTLLLSELSRMYPLELMSMDALLLAMRGDREAALSSARSGQ
jgi:hypothetical protein